ncbi:dioxygenase [Neisseria iguanae]|uniref:Dioxygenase n=1 Tax=Neisseria iguanae TaxID=90242 RepID=A0A2P7TXG1_9NEIS|nr:dioxygenase [Neisseria iguanae]PSJ79422.1 dioxygenase [Neisseria iguanae]
MSELIDLIQTESVGTVGETLDFLLYECSMDDAPSSEEVVQWRDVLNRRGGKFLRLAELCQTWLDEEGQHDFAAQ